MQAVRAHRALSQFHLGPCPSLFLVNPSLYSISDPHRTLKRLAEALATPL
jgi:hypothetical protein